MTARQKKPAFRVGDRVQFLHLGRKVPGTIAEVHGAVGIGGRRLYRVEMPAEPFDPVRFVFPEAELEPGGDPAEKLNLLTKPRIIDYLKHGALISMLMSESPRGENQPRVWLCIDVYDNVTYTFREAQGLIGGISVPRGAHYRDLK